MSSRGVHLDTHSLLIAAKQCGSSNRVEDCGKTEKKRKKKQVERQNIHECTIKIDHWKYLEWLLDNGVSYEKHHSEIACIVHSSASQAGESKV